MSYHSITLIGHARGDIKRVKEGYPLKVEFSMEVFDQTDIDRERKKIRYEVHAWGVLAVRALLEEDIEGRHLVVEGTPFVEVRHEDGLEPWAQLIVAAYKLRFMP